MDSFWDSYAWPGIIIVAQILAIVVPMLAAIGYLIYAERKILGAMQMRKGPNVVGPFGLLQPLADGIKIIFKEIIIPSGASPVVFITAPIVTMALPLLAWAVIPVEVGWVLADINVGMLYLFAISSLGVYGVIMAGWASNSKYAFLGALRSAAQMVSYEVSIGFVMISVLLCVGSLNLTEIVEAQDGLWFAVPLLPMFVVFFISALAETNRTPFDLPEAEAELVSGYNVEYSSITFSLFILAEYGHMIVMSGIITVLFMGGWLPLIDLPPFNWIPGQVWFAGKMMLFLFLFIWVRATVPRYRYDQLMRLGWKVFLPLSLFWLVLTAGVLVTFGWVPVSA